MEDTHEAHISTQSAGSEEKTRLSRSNGDGWWPQGPRTSSRQGTSPFVRLDVGISSLRHRSAFVALAQSPHRVSFPFMVVQIKPVSTPVTKPFLGYGMIASRKVGNAVVRNRIKRRIRALIREFFPLMRCDVSIHLVVVARRGFEKVFYSTLREAMGNAFQKFNLITSKTSS